MRASNTVAPLAEFEKLRPEMKNTAHIRKYAAEQGIAEDEALKKGMEAKSKEFVNKGAEVYAKV